MELIEFKAIMNKVIEDNSLYEQKFKKMKNEIDAAGSIEEKLRILEEFKEIEKTK